MDLNPGDALAARFEVLARAGGGGMGSVYRARDLSSGELIALKVLRATGGESAERFQREAAVLAELRHPGIVRYVAHGVTSEGRAYLALEWLDGEDLSKRLARGPLMLAESVALAQRVAEALAFAHARGVVHRDVKPGNLFLRGGRPEGAMLLDFGIARGEADACITQTGTVVGTPGYIAPEQARGLREVDARADVFALGCVLFHCITGQRPFHASDAVAVFARVLFEEARRTRDLTPDVPSALDDLVARMLTKEPAGRPRDGAEVARALAALQPMPEEPPTRRHGPSAVPAVLTAACERRLVSVILVAPSRASDDGAEETLRDGAPRVHATSPRPPPRPPPRPAPTPIPGSAASLREIAAPFAATVEQIATGSVVATLTSGASATDQAARAARCALAMRRAAGGARMALATGRSVVSAPRDRAHLPHLPVGDAIDRAVALLRQPPRADAAPGAASAIHLDDVTAGLLDASFDVRGDATGLTLTLHGEREVIEPGRTLMGRPYPCYGRERELATLVGIFDECVAEPTAQAVVITGASGVGKSRVRYELTQNVRDRRPDATVWLARGDPMSAGSPFGMIAPIVVRAAGAQDGEPLAARQKKLRARVGRHMPPKHVARVTEFLGEMAGVPFDDDDSEALHAARNDSMLMGDQMRAAWIDFVLAEATGQPVLVVLEDLHWGDVPSVKFFDALLREARDRPLMVLALARPEVSDVFPQLWSGRTVTTMRLGGLSKKAATRFARDMLAPHEDTASGSAASDDDIERVVDRAQGNAFYLEELIRSVAQGRGDALPETVLAMAQARLEGLEPAARLVLRAASIFGETFWSGGVAALLGAEARQRDLAADVARLCENEIVFRRGEGKFPGEVEYIFRHALFREAASAMLTEEDAALGHKLAAEWLERAGEANAAVLAEHFERGGEKLRAVDGYHRAAEQALDGGDLEAAITRCERGIACGAAEPVLGALRYLQAEAHNWRGEHAQAQVRALEAMRALTPGGTLWYGAAAEVIVAAGRLLDHPRVLDTVGALMRAQPRPSSAERQRGEAAVRRVTALARAVPVLLFGGHSALAGELARELDRASDVGDPIALARRQEALAAIAMVAGEDARYLELARSAIESFERVGAARNVCIARVNAGYAYMKCGAYAEAGRALREALAEAERTGLYYVATAAKHNLGLVLARLGALDEAMVVEADAAGLAQAQGDVRIAGGSRVYLAMIHEMRAELTEAEVEARRAIAVLEAIPPTRAVATAVLARVLLVRGASGEALAAAREAMALLDVLGGLEEGEALVRVVHAEALRATGDDAGARAAIRAAKARLDARAAKLKDPALERSFRTRVPENARTLELAAELDPDG